MRILFWGLGVLVVTLALSVPLTARAAELADPQVGAFERGRAALEAGEPEVALGHLRAVSRRDPNCAEALRTIGWELLAEQRGETAAGVSYVNSSLLVDPFSGETWGAWARLHLRLLGLGD